MNYPVPEQSVSDEFVKCWSAAGRHLSHVKSVFPIEFAWLKSDLRLPTLEHMSFRLGNQLFFVRVEDMDGHVTGPGSHDGLFHIAEACNGHACLMLMQRSGPDWSVAAAGWGLVDARTLKLVDPCELVTRERIEMTDWELHDFAVQAVAQMLERDGLEVSQVQGAPDVDPSIWFNGENGLEWVVVRAVRYPERRAQPPSNLSAIASYCAGVGARGHFASVGVSGANEPYDGSPHTLWRGDGMYVAYDGLEPVEAPPR